MLIPLFLNALFANLISGEKILYSVQHAAKVWKYWKRALDVNFVENT